MIFDFCAAASPVSSERPGWKTQPWRRAASRWALTSGARSLEAVNACSLEAVAHLDEERLGARLLVRGGLAHEAEGDPAVGGELGEVVGAELLLEEAVLRKLAPGERHLPIAHLHRLEVLADGRLARDRLPVELELGRGGELLEGSGAEHRVAGALELAHGSRLGEALVEEHRLGLLQGRLVGVRVGLGLALDLAVALRLAEVQLAHHLAVLAGSRSGLGGGCSAGLSGSSGSSGLRGRLDGRRLGRCGRGHRSRSSGSRRLLDRGLRHRLHVGLGVAGLGLAGLGLALHGLRHGGRSCRSGCRSRRRARVARVARAEAGPCPCRRSGRDGNRLRGRGLRGRGLGHVGSDRCGLRHRL